MELRTCDLKPPADLDRAQPNFQKEVRKKENRHQWIYVPLASRTELRGMAPSRLGP
jgi:hypothetical protein